MGFINIEQLIALRTTKGWDQKQLADAAGIDRSVISRIERGLQADCRVSVLVAISNALGITPEHLISQADQPTNKLNLSPNLVAVLSRLEKAPTNVQDHAALILNAFLQGTED